MADFGLGEQPLDLSAFSLETGPQIKTRYVRPRRFKDVKPYAVKYERAAALVEEIGPQIMAGHRIDALISGNFIFGDFFEALAVAADMQIDDLTFSTLSVSQENVDSLRNLMTGGYLDRLNMIVSDYFWGHNRQNAKYIYDALDIDDRFQLAVAGTHTKIALMTFDGRKFVVHGSANMRSSRSVEVFTTEENPDLYDFHMEWHKAILDRYATIKKSIRAGKAFNGIAKGIWT